MTKYIADRIAHIFAPHRPSESYPLPKRRLEFRVLDNRVWLEPRESEAAASSSFDDLGELIPPPAVGLEPEDFLVDAACTHDILATLSWDHAGICRFPVIRLLRFPRREQGAVREDGDDADED